MARAHTYTPFPSTHWTLIGAVQDGNASEAKLALGLICECYWYPIYAFLRRSGQGSSNAEDLTQVFFQRLIERDTLKALQPEGGKLRSFLLGCLKQTLSDHARHGNAQKRGGLIPHVSFDEMEAEERYQHEPQDTRDAEWLFTRAWAHEIFDKVRAKLKISFVQSRSPETFDALLPHISLGDEPPSYREIAKKIGGSTANARILVFRLREKFRDLLREEVALTVSTPEDVTLEMGWLKSMLEEN